MSGLLDTLGNMIGRLWAGGQAFLWGCAAACVLGVRQSSGGSFTIWDSGSYRSASFYGAGHRENMGGSTEESSVLHFQ